MAEGTLACEEPRASSLSNGINIAGHPYVPAGEPAPGHTLMSGKATVCVFSGLRVENTDKGPGQCHRASEEAPRPDLGSPRTLATVPALPRGGAGGPARRGSTSGTAHLPSLCPCPVGTGTEATPPCPIPPPRMGSGWEADGKPGPPRRGRACRAAPAVPSLPAGRAPAPTTRSGPRELAVRALHSQGFVTTTTELFSGRDHSLQTGSTRDLSSHIQEPAGIANAASPRGKAGHRSDLAAGTLGPSAVPTFMPAPPWRSRAFLCSLVTAHRARSLSSWAPQDTARGLPALARAVSAALTATPAASQCYGNSDGARPWKARLSGRAAACLKSDLEQRPCSGPTTLGVRHR